MSTVSRRRRKAVPSSDIEDGQPSTQNSREDVDEEEEERPRPGRKMIKKEKKLKPERIAEDDDELANQADDFDDDDDLIDIEEYTKDQPVHNIEASKIAIMAGMVRDWAQVIDSISQESNAIIDTAITLADYGEGDAKAQGLIELEDIMKSFIDNEKEMEYHRDTLNDLHQQLLLGEPIIGIVEEYDRIVDEKVEARSSLTTRQKYSKIVSYSTFKQKIFEIEHPDEVVPPIMDMVPKEDGDDNSDNDDDIEIGGVKKDYKCPLTLMILVNPYTSRICGHSFSWDAINDSFRNKSEMKSCPTSGCNKKFKLDDLYKDDKLARDIKAHLRRQQRRQQEVEVDEVID